MIPNWRPFPRAARDRKLVLNSCDGHGGYELSFDWDVDQSYSNTWAERQGELAQGWQRARPQGPRWWRIADYHRYGWAARQKYAELSWDAVRCGFWTAYSAGKWDTRDEWDQIEDALRHGWEQADAAEPAAGRGPAATEAVNR